MGPQTVVPHEQKKKTSVGPPVVSSQPPGGELSILVVQSKSAIGHQQAWLNGVDGRGWCGTNSSCTNIIYPLVIQHNY